MIQRLLSLLFIGLMAASCKNEQAGSFVIRLDQAEYKQLNLSDYVASLEYVPLETTPECLIDKYPNFYVLDKYIVASTWKQCFLFDRNGKFIREIGHAGKGPEEYNSTMSGETMNEEKQTVLMRGWGNIMEYSFEGKVTGHLSLLKNMCATACVSDSIWAQGIVNQNGDAPNQLMFVNRAEVIDSIPNHQFFEIGHTSMRSFIFECHFYRHQDDLYYKNLFNDTIFHIQNRELRPTWVFDMGDYHLPYSIRANPETFFDEIRKYNQVEKVLETDPFLLFSVKREKGDSAFIFDKQANKTVVLSKEQNLNGFYNDVDGGMPFWPKHINRKQEMVSFLYAEDMKEMLTDDYFNQKNIQDKAAHQQLKELLSRIKENDNPVVVIAKLK